MHGPVLNRIESAVRFARYQKRANIGLLPHVATRVANLGNIIFILIVIIDCESIDDMGDVSSSGQADSFTY